MVRRPGLRRLLVVSAVFAVAALAPVTPEPAGAQAGSPRFEVLSGRPDLVTGGDVLVEVVAPPGASLDGVRVDVDGRDVTGVFTRRSDGRFLGVVTGLALGRNVLTARLGDGSGARLSLTNHPAGGPVFSGAQIQPWLCTTESHALGPAADAQCNAPTKTEFFYRSSNPARPGFQPYDPASPPGDVATTTTDQGEAVPYVVRRETGAQNRGIYSIAVLTDPKEPWSPTARQRGWNRKLFYIFGVSCGTVHSQSAPSDVLNDMALSRGFMVAGSSLNVLGNNCNTVTSAESTMMLKERIVEGYGPIRYTFGTGCSGGSIGQHMVANAYPGLIDGLLPSCSYTDTWSTSNEVQDCHLLVRYFSVTSPHLWGAAQQRAFVSGHQSPSSCLAWEALFAAVHNPRDGCGLPADQMYHPTTNPGGCRGSLQDFQVPIFGRRASDLWTDPEKALGRGFAKWAFDNVGIQYGLNALQAGQISAEQFVDLNEKVGGMDIDQNFVAGRKAADPGSVRIVHQTGQLNDARELDRVPIIDLRGSSNNEIHTDFHSWALRARLDHANGHHDNQIVWTSPVALVGEPAWTQQAFLLMDRWLTAVEGDTSDASLEEKVRRNKPADAVDACWIAGQKVTTESTCRAAFPYFAAPRIAAGGPFRHDVMKCQLKPLNRAEYTATFTDAQWARLQAAFPSGVCDWSKPGVDQVASQAWMTFAGGPGGRALGAAPTSVPFGSSVLSRAGTRSLPATGGPSAAAIALALLAVAGAARLAVRRS